MISEIQISLIPGISPEQKKQYAGQEKAMSLGGNDWSATFFAVLKKIPSNHTFYTVVLQTIGKTSQKSLQKLKAYIEKISQPFDSDCYTAGGAILQTICKRKNSKITEADLNQITSTAKLNIDLRENQKVLSSRSLPRAEVLILFKVKDTWYMPLDEQKPKQINNISSRKCLMCNKESQELLKIGCSHEYCRQCLMNHFLKYTSYACKDNFCPNIIKKIDFQKMAYEKSGCLSCGNQISLIKSVCGHEYCQQCVLTKQLSTCKVCAERLQFKETASSQQNSKVLCNECQIYGSSSDFFQNLACKHYYCYQCCVEKVKSNNIYFCSRKICATLIDESRLKLYVQLQQKSNSSQQQQIISKDQKQPENTPIQKQQNKLSDTSQRKTPFQCRICCKYFDDDKELYCNTCQHFYCKSCISFQLDSKFKDNADCPKCGNPYLLSEVRSFFVKNQQKYFFFTNYIVTRETTVCSVCNVSQEDKRKVFLNEYCGHKICLTCIEKKGLEGNYCYVRSCSRRIRSELVEEFYNEMCVNALSQSEMALEERKCLKCQEVNKTPSKIEYFKCTKCDTLTCGKHNELLKECLCLCTKCLNELKPFENNHVYCGKCKTKVCLFCKEKTNQQKLHNCNFQEPSSNGNQQIQEKKNQEMKKGSTIIGKQSQLQQEEINITQCGSCLCEFDEFVIPYAVESCKIHKQCMNCKFSSSRCTLCSGKFDRFNKPLDDGILTQKN